MKILAFILLISNSVMAYTTVGDQVELVGHMQGKKASYSTTIVNKSDDGSEFTLKTIKHLEDQAPVEEIQISSANDMVTADMIGIIMLLCETELKGKLETIIVPAGEFNTCAVTGDDGALYHLGEVPFGLIRYQSLNELFELKSFKNSQE